MRPLPRTTIGKAGLEENGLPVEGVRLVPTDRLAPSALDRPTTWYARAIDQEEVLHPCKLQSGLLDLQG